jgi:hypothetical protein
VKYLVVESSSCFDMCWIGLISSSNRRIRREVVAQDEEGYSGRKQGEG